MLANEVHSLQNSSFPIGTVIFPGENVMLEILLVFWLCSSLGKILRRKGRKPLMFQIFCGISWFVGEVLGAIIGSIFQMIRLGDQEPPGFDWTIYIFALAGAACGAGFWFLVANVLPPAEPAWQGTGGAQDPVIGPPLEQRPPLDPDNPYAPPRRDR